LTSSGAKFVDGSEEKFSVIIYATGYEYSYPFLSSDSGLSSFNKKVFPLYKHCLNINNPTMAILGLPYFALTMPLFDLQVRFLFQFWTKRKSLPSKEEMLKDTIRDIEERKKKGFGERRTHFFLPLSDYNEELAETAEIEPLRPVLQNMIRHIFSKLFFNCDDFRKYYCEIINDSEFECKIISE
jgi:dimethylaniline monooxygenase (N-oxide forming)